MQNCYGNAIRHNKGDLKSIKNSIKAIQHHVNINESLPLEKQHLYCPKDGNSWCKFWRDKLEGSSTYDAPIRGRIWSEGNTASRLFTQVY